MHRAEHGLFGQTGGAGSSGQSRILFAISAKCARTPSAPAAVKDWLESTGGWSISIQYLLGQGLWGRGRIQRGALLPKAGDASDCDLEILVRPGTPDNQIESLLDAIELFGMLGGVGSRSRRGWGSMSLREIAGTERTGPVDADGMQRRLAELMGTPTSKEPPFSAFSSYTRIDVSASAPNAGAVLNKLGSQMLRFRSCGRGGILDLDGSPASNRFRVSDHDVVLNAINGAAPTAHPRRAAFGLPHNYFFSSVNTKADVNAHKHDRRASPLLMKVARLGNGQFVGVQTLLQARFLPQADCIVVNPKHGREWLVTPNVDWGVLREYLDSFDPQQRRTLV